MSQMSFSDFEYAGKRKQTRRERFLAEMEPVVPWSALVALIEPHYPKAGGGRKPYPLETMLRIHLVSVRPSHLPDTPAEGHGVHLI
ncbi:hypothetical protein D3C81_212910 [compost metagenome]